MTMLAFAASVVLGCSMCAAGGAKIAMGAQWPAEAASMGAPRPIVPVLPWIELVCGALLIAQWQRQTIALIVGVMLLGFTVAIIVQLARGRHPSCACFGSWSARPLGWRHVIRNAVLLVLASVLVAW
jgi:uncharacterized membrane protein YphA (DoxX/SURF4 family)